MRPFLDAALAFRPSQTHARQATLTGLMAHVLVIDDSRDVCRAVAAFLKMHGHAAYCVLSGHAGLAYLQTALPDLIVLDVMMPGMDGREVLQRIRGDARTRGVP